MDFVNQYRDWALDLEHAITERILTKLLVPSLYFPNQKIDTSSGIHISSNAMHLVGKK